MRRTELSTQTPSLSQPLTQCAHLSARTLTTSGTQAQLLHQHIGGGGEQHAQLVGEEVRTAGAVDLQPMVQFFDAVLDLTPSAVDTLVQMPWGSGEVGHDKACVVLRLPAFQPHDLCFDEDAALASLPTARGIARLAKQGCRLRL